MAAFLDDLTADLANNFFNVEEFGENLTLIRGGTSTTIQGLYDSPVATADSMGIDVEAIAHYPRLFVRQADLPGGKPSKNDRFALYSNQFHSSLSLVALDYVFEKDGVVVYRCKGIA